MAQSPRDQNYVPAVLLESSTNPGTVITAKGDQVTGRLLADLASTVGTVTQVSTGTGLTGGPITTTGTISLSTPLAPMATLTGNSLKVLRVNAGETAVEYATISTSTALTIGSTTIASGTNGRILYDNSGVLGELTTTGSGSVVLATSPTLVTPTLGVASATSINGLVITATAGTLTIPNNAAAALVTSGNFSITLTATGATAVTLPTSGTLVSSVSTANGVSASNTAGALTFTLGAITPTTVNGLTITSSTGTLTVTNAKTLSISKTMSFTAADDTGVYTLPTGTKTLLATDGAGTSLTGIPYTLTGTANQVILSAGTGNITFSLPQSIGTGSGPQSATIELGAATDTTLSRVSAGVIAVEGVNVVLTTVTTLSSLTSVGTITTGGLGTGATLGSVTVNIASSAVGDIYYAGASNVLTRLASPAAGKILASGGATTAPVWSTPTFPTSASATSGKVIKSDGTNWVASTETYAAPGTSGNVMTSDGTNWTSAAPAAASSSKMLMATSFESTGRFRQAGSGTSTFDTNGVVIDTGGTANDRNLYWDIGGGNNAGVFSGSPILSGIFKVQTVAATNNQGYFYFGFCDVSNNGSGASLVGEHIGFKVRATGTSQWSLYATQADGATENASAALTTFVANDVMDLIIKVNSTTSVDYYWRKNGGALSSATNLTSNMPTTATYVIDFYVASNGGRNACYLIGASYTR